MTFASMEKDFEALNTELVGLSVDGLHSHIAWLRTIKEKIDYRGMRDVEVNFPLIDDVSMKVATKYGMIMPGEDTPGPFARSSSSTARAWCARSPRSGWTPLPRR